MDEFAAKEIDFTIDLFAFTFQLKAFVVRMTDTKFFIPTIIFPGNKNLPFIEDIFITKVQKNDFYVWVHSNNDQQSILANQLGNAIDLHPELFDIKNK